jgi:GH35 family endo-1,4-beta-xylanase
MSSVQNAHARTDDRYSFNVFGDADRFAKFVKDNGLQARGHATIWHSQLASWVYKLTDPVDLVCHFFPYNTDFQSTSVLATYLLMSDVLTLSGSQTEAIRNHITQVNTRYKGTFQCKSCISMTKLM